MFYEVEANSPEEAKEIALANQKDWERPDEHTEQEYFLPPVIEEVKEE